MRRRWASVGSALFFVAWLLATACADERPEPLPTIVTYELAKTRSQARDLSHDPKRFWAGEIVARLEDRKPSLPHDLRRPLTVEVGFVVARDGRLVSKTVARSSGEPAIDKQALAVLDRAAPFPPMPAALSDDHLAFTVPLRFR